jgi:hypothetical protein
LSEDLQHVERLAHMKGRSRLLLGPPKAKA